MYDNRAEIIKQNVSMQECFEFYGLEVKKGMCLCPFHNEKTPSLKVFADHYHCFGCQSHGDVITFVMSFFKISYNEAIKKISIDFSLKIVDITYADMIHLRSNKCRKNWERRNR